jgi:hypothetical protein
MPPNGNVFRDLGFDEAEAEHLRRRRPLRMSSHRPRQESWEGSLSYLRKLIEQLRYLSDEKSQRRAWFASEGPEVSSFTEDVCQMFDDTGLSHDLYFDRCPPVLDPFSFSLLHKLKWAVSAIDHGTPEEEIISSFKMERVREIAAQAADYIEQLYSRLQEPAGNPPHVAH